MKEREMQLIKYKRELNRKLPKYWKERSLAHRVGDEAVGPRTDYDNTHRYPNLEPLRTAVQSIVDDILGMRGIDRETLAPDEVLKAELEILHVYMQTRLEETATSLIPTGLETETFSAEVSSSPTTLILVDRFKNTTTDFRLDGRAKHALGYMALIAAVTLEKRVVPWVTVEYAINQAQGKPGKGIFFGTVRPLVERGLFTHGNRLGMLPNANMYEVLAALNSNKEAHRIEISGYKQVKKDVMGDQIVVEPTHLSVLRALLTLHEQKPVTAYLRAEDVRELTNRGSVSQINNVLNQLCALGLLSERVSAHVQRLICSINVRKIAEIVELNSHQAAYEVTRT